MAFGVDTTSHATKVDTSVITTLTWSHTCGASANKLVVIACGAGGLPGRNISGVTYNSVALTKLAEQDDGVFENAEIWRLNSPTTGSAQNIVVTYGDTGVQQAAGAISFNESSATEGTPTQATASTANPSMSVSSEAGDICVGGYASDLGSNGTTTANGTEIWEDEDVGGGDSDFSAQRVTASGASTTVSWTAIAGDLWSICGIAIKAAAGGAAVNAVPIIDYYYRMIGAKD